MLITFRAASHTGSGDVTVANSWDYDHTSRVVSGSNNATAIVTLTTGGATEFENNFPRIARGDWVVIEG